MVKNFTNEDGRVKGMLLRMQMVLIVSTKKALRASDQRISQLMAMFGTMQALMVRLLQVLKLSMDNTSTLMQHSRLRVLLGEMRWYTHSKYDAATGERLTNEFSGNRRQQLYHIGATVSKIGEVKIGAHTYYFA